MKVSTPGNHQGQYRQNHQFNGLNTRVFNQNYPNGEAQSWCNNKYGRNPFNTFTRNEEESRLKMKNGNAYKNSNVGGERLLPGRWDTKTPCKKEQAKGWEVRKLVIVGHSRIANESPTPLFFVLIVVVHRRVWNT